MNNESDKKTSVDADADTKEIKYPSRRESRKSLRSKLPFVELFEEISWRYVRNVALAVLFCIVTVGGVLVFVDPSVVQVETPTLVENETETQTVDEKRVHIKIREGLSTA